MIGVPFRVEELAAVDVLGGLGRYVACVNDPPWTELSGSVPEPLQVVHAGDMSLDRLDRAASAVDDAAEVIVGVGGGTALDTAKHLAWRTGHPLVQIPTITSVDAGFTDAIGVRVDGRVRYVGHVVPRFVVLDVPLVRSAPARLNRAGVGDVLSCHTGLHDWRLAADLGRGPGWDDTLAELGRALLRELDAAADEIRHVTADGVRFLADAYRRIGAACAAAEHSRFEEGSEHFLGYSIERRTGRSFVHGELIAFGVVAMSVVQGNEPAWAARIVDRTGVAAHPDRLGLDRSTFDTVVASLAADVVEAGLDASVIDLVEHDPSIWETAWDTVRHLAC
jgi:glycerol dehydrogenase-like iron-containing ADH family enzyme